MTEDDVALWGWEPIPEEQTTLAEILLEEGYQTLFVTDTYHQFKPSMNFHRGFGVFDYVRGQERDRYKATHKVPEEEVNRYTVPGNDMSMRDKVRQYRANVAGRTREEDWFGPRVFLRGMDYLQTAAEVGGPFFLFVDSFDPHEPWDPPEEYANMYGDPTGTGEPIVPNYATSDYLEEEELTRMRALLFGAAETGSRGLPAWAGLPFAIASLAGLIAVARDFGSFGAALWAVFGTGWAWLGFALLVGSFQETRRTTRAADRDQTAAVRQTGERRTAG